MIRTDEQLQQTRGALADLEGSLAALNRRKAEIHPDRFALMVEPILDHIHQLRAEIDAYLGVTEAETALVPLWLRLEGPGIVLQDAPTSVVTAIIDLFRVGVQAVAEFLLRGSPTTRPTAWLKQACDFRLWGLAAGSVQVGLRLPELAPELFPDESVESQVRRALDLYIVTAGWAGSEEDAGRLEAAIPDPEERRIVLNQVARLIPRPRGQLELVEISGRLARQGSARLRRESRQRVRDAMTRTVREELVEATGVLREIDLDARTIHVRDLTTGQETRCAIPTEADDLLGIAKESLDYRVTVFGSRRIDPARRQAFPLQVRDIEVLGRQGEEEGDGSAVTPQS